MKINFKKKLLIFSILFINSIFLVNEFDKECLPNYDIVKSTISELANLSLIDNLATALLSDISSISQQVQNIAEQMRKNADNLTEIVENNLEEMVFDYRASIVAINNYDKINYFSEETKQRFLSSMLFGIGNMMTQKSKMEKLLNNQQLSGVIFLMTAMGVEFTFIKVLEKIMNKILDKCASLKNMDLDNLVYEATIYEIFNVISEKMVNKGFFKNMFNQIFNASLIKMKDNINNFKINNSQNTKKLKNKKNK